MDAAEFNTLYPVGTVFIHQTHESMSYGEEVGTVDVARDFRCGVIVEINVAPYFARAEALIPVTRFGQGSQA